MSLPLSQRHVQSHHPHLVRDRRVVVHSIYMPPSASTLHTCSSSVDSSPPSSPLKKKARLSAPDAAQDLVNDDLENPFNASNPGSGHASTSALPRFTFTSALLVGDLSSRKYERSPSPEAQPEQDYDAWFASANIPPAAFQTASFITPSTSTSDLPSFISLGSRKTLAPSAVALSKAQERLKDIWEADSSTDDVGPPSKEATAESNTAEYTAEPKTENTPTTPSMIPRRPALQPIQNGFQPPSTPTPSTFTRPLASGKQVALGHLRKNTAFRSPLIRNSPNPTFTNSPLNPASGFSSASRLTQGQSATSLPIAPTTPIRQTTYTPKSSAFQSPFSIRPNCVRSTPAPFVTPFKPGMRPGEPGRLKLQESTQKGPPQLFVRSTPLKFPSQAKSSHLVTNIQKSFFDLRCTKPRKTLAESGLRPQQYTQDDFESKDINILELQNINPKTAIYYSFHTASTLPPSQDQARESLPLLGPDVALKQLHDVGCSLATKPWVDNHWCLILWKLAGMVALDPNSETNPETKRWCWNEVKCQLLYRYERELNQAKRPALRLISTQDAPAAFPLALCVSDIIWVESEDAPGRRDAELEVTDGWYRLRAKIDAPLTRAVKKGKICVGTKIGIAGAKLFSERKEPQEILEAYSSVKLILKGNSSHLLSWHAKLGFMRGPCISTMHSLTPDGGLAAAMDVVVLKSHVLGFVEFVVNEHGQKRREGPWDEIQERKTNEEWKKRRELEATKIRSEYEKKAKRYQSYIDRLQRRAGTASIPRDDEDSPDHIDSLYDQMEEHGDAQTILTTITRQDAAWLARHIDRCLQAEQELLGDVIDKELESSCPPREVRNFRVIVVQDSQSCRRPANRHAQLTVWDVLNLTFSDGGKPGEIKPGARFLVTNLIPSQASAWMDNTPGAEIFLTTTPMTKWRKLKSPS